MKTSSFSPALNPEIAKAVEDCIRQLELPNEALMIQSLRDHQRQLEAHQRALMLLKECLESEGLAALGRILLSRADIEGGPESDYFKRH